MFAKTAIQAVDARWGCAPGFFPAILPRCITALWLPISPARLNTRGLGTNIPRIVRPIIHNTGLDHRCCSGTHNMPGPKAGTMSNQAMPAMSPNCSQEALAAMPSEHRLACQKSHRQ